MPSSSDRNFAVTPEVVLGAAVANAGTITFPYPNGETSTSQSWLTTDCVLVDSQGNSYSSGFTVAYGASTITVTNSSLGTLAAGRKFRLQANYYGIGQVALDPVTYALDASGNITGLAGTGGVPATLSDITFTEHGRTRVDGNSPPQHWGGQIVSGDYSISSGSPTLSVVTRNGRQALKIVTGSGVTANVDLTLNTDVSWYGRAYFEVEGGREAGCSQITTLVTPDNFTNYAQNTFTALTSPLNNPAEQGGIFTFRADGQVTSGATATQYTGTGASWGVSTPTLDGTTTVNKIRFRVIPIAATVATVYLYGVSLGPRRKKGRIFVCADDGYKSFMNIGFPLLSARGIPVTVGVIGHLMDNRTDVAGYMNWNDIRQIVAAGGQAVAHGPVLSSAAGNLISNYTTNADRVADMVAARNYIQANGCASPGFDKVYVWPQGNFQSASGDVTLLDAAIEAGFVVGRSATPNTSTQVDFSALSKYQRLALPIIGHTYAGGSESTNITTITSAITAANTARSDLILMLHKTVKNADTPDSIGITVGNLATIADALQTVIDAGTMTAGVLSDLAEPSVWAD